MEGDRFSFVQIFFFTRSPAEERPRRVEGDRRPAPSEALPHQSGTRAGADTHASGTDPPDAPRIGPDNFILTI